MVWESRLSMFKRKFLFFPKKMRLLFVGRLTENLLLRRRLGQRRRAFPQNKQGFFKKGDLRELVQKIDSYFITLLFVDEKEFLLKFLMLLFWCYQWSRVILFSCSFIIYFNEITAQILYSEIIFICNSKGLFDTTLSSVFDKSRMVKC